LTDDQARHLTEHGMVRNEDGTFCWKYDNYFRVRAPYPVTTAESVAFWREIACPVLLIRGTESWATDPVADGRAQHFRNVKVRDIEGAGHWVHHDRLEQFLAETRAFLAAT
jgi:pimeloyl-ACP methyl ester carboxylesterase